MNQTNTRFRPIALLGLAASILLLTALAAWGKHNKVPCTSCHHPAADGSAPYTSEDLVQPKAVLCRSCHDATLDVSGLSVPHVFYGRPDLAGGSFTPTLLSDGTGHNMHTVDTTLGMTPPGGAPLAEFGCLSCHDAHDNGNYRNLKKTINGYATSVVASGDPEFRQNVYISGMNDFCGACHEKFYRAGNGKGLRGWTRHPVGMAISDAQHADFQHWSRLNDKVTQAQHPSGRSDDAYGAEVFCLSCHRAHASPFTDALRWDYGQTNRGCLECHPF